MKIIFDALGSTRLSGGMRLHSTELVRAWRELFPEDEIWFVSGGWAKEGSAQIANHVIALPNESIFGRAVGQLVFTPILRVLYGADVVISLSPLVSPFVPRNRAYCFQHDWRHKRLPTEFPIWQRVYRRLWEISARRARLNLCISEKAARETRSFVPGARTRVIENGWDHPRSWPALDSAARSGGSIVTFGHHNNKRPELVIRAYARVRGQLTPSSQLVVLGARSAYANELRELSRGLGVEDSVVLPGFVDEASYQRIISQASTIVLASTDEGFGLPVAEACYLGIPVIVTRDSGIASLFGDFPTVVEPDANELGRALLSAVQHSGKRADPAVQWRSWRDVATELRRTIASSGDLDEPTA